MREHDPDRVLRDVGRRIAELRRQKGYTQERLAEKAEVSIKFLQRVEGGRENLTVRSLTRFAALLQVGVPELFTVPVNRTVRRGRPPTAEPGHRAGARPRSRKPAVAGVARLSR
ncbi:MAG: helix-turn-helix transcriptional regulator [Deltaproteobacteria bacterium]|nr:helix-turn-helix transcriptional regulator [Deltaproteobacteria bacterium]